MSKEYERGVLSPLENYRSVLYKRGHLINGKQMIVEIARMVNNEIRPYSVVVYNVEDYSNFQLELTSKQGM